MEIQKTERLKQETSPEVQEKINQLVNQIDVKDSQLVITYGTNVQKDISQFSDKVLETVRTKDTGPAGEAIGELMVKLKEIDMNGAGKSSAISKIPIIGSLFNKAKKLITQYEKVSVHIDRIEQKLEKEKIQMLKDITMLDTMYEKNKLFFQDLSIFIAAGEEKLKELNEVTIPALKEKAKAADDMVVTQELNDMVQITNRFEKKIHDLKLSREITIQTAPQIRLIQNNNQLLAEKIQSSILQTIPLWKNQMVIALSLHNQKSALEMQKQVTNTTNDLLLKNSELLKQGSVEVAKEAERGIVDIETLKTTHANLISTLEETLTIQQEGSKKRQEAEVELVRLEEDLKTKLLHMAKQNER